MESLQKLGNKQNNNSSSTLSSLGIACLISSAVLILLIIFCWQGFFTDKKPPDITIQQPTQLTVKYCVNGICN